VIRVTRSIVLGVIMVMLLASAGVAAAASPTETVRVAVKQVFPEQGAIPAPKVSTDQRRAQIRQVAESLFDFQEMSRIALGGYWTQVSPADKDEFTRLFASLIANSYMGKIEQYAGEPISYVGERVDGNAAVVQSRVVTPKGSQIQVEYRLNKTGDRWAVYDLYVDGVSLVANYKTQFSRMIQRGSFADVLKALRQKAGS
jgi:phospholipid transport system substrate-binding protein